MPPPADARRGRVRTIVGLALGLLSLGFVLWLTCRPADAVHSDRATGVVHAGTRSNARTSIVVSALRSQARLADPGTPIPEDEWSRARRTATVNVAPDLARTLLARTLPPPAELVHEGNANDPEAPIGSVAHVDDGSLRVIDGWTNGTQDLQVELRLWPSPEGTPRAEAGAWDVRGGDPPSAWSELSCAVTTSRATWADGEPVVLRYRVRGVDALGDARDESGLVRITVP